MEKLTRAEIGEIIDKHNIENNIIRQFEDENPIMFAIVYDASNWPDKKLTLEERTYIVRSDNKAFLPDMGGSSMYGNCLDGVDRHVRLDWYDWKPEYFYIV